MGQFFDETTETRPPGFAARATRGRPPAVAGGPYPHWLDKLGDTFIKEILCGLWATICFTPVYLADDGKFPNRWALARFFLFGLALAFLLSYGKPVWRILHNRMGSHRRVD